jgi:hypothetical protein
MSVIRMAAVDAQLLLIAAKCVKDVMADENFPIDDRFLCAIDVARPARSNAMSYFLKGSDTLIVTFTDMGSEWKGTVHHAYGVYSIRTVVSAKSSRVSLYGSEVGMRVAKMSRALLDSGVIVSDSSSLAANSVLLAYKMSVHPDTYRAEVEAYVDTYHDTLEGRKRCGTLFFPPRICVSSDSTSTWSSDKFCNRLRFEIHAHMEHLQRRHLGDQELDPGFRIHVDHDGLTVLD